MSFLFEYNDIDRKIWYLQYIQALKWLHDRGFNVDDITDFGQYQVSTFLEVLFGEQNISWEEFRPDALGYDQSKMDEDSEEADDEYAFNVDNLLSRGHFFIHIKIPELMQNASKLRPRHYKRLMEKLEELLPCLEDTEGVHPWWSLFKEVFWLRNKTTGTIYGIEIVFVEIEPDWTDDEPYFINEFREIINFWDTLQEIVREVKNNESIRRSLHPHKTGRFYPINRITKRHTKGNADQSGRSFIGPQKLAS